MDLLQHLNDHPMYIDGEWRESPKGTIRTVLNPADGKPIGSYHVGDRSTASGALEAARKAFPEWSGVPARSRADILLRAADLIREHEDQLARIITLENGKALKESQAEIAGAAHHFQWFAEEGCRAYGRIVPPMDPRKRHLVIRQPVGVAACVTPFNFPLLLWARKVAPALAAGCTVVARSASQTSLTALAAARLIDTLSIPPGALNLVTGPADEVVGEFLESKLCRKISFTGSTEVGKELMRRAADTVKNLSMELGGQCPAVVCADADLEEATRGTVGGKFRNGGQSCIAINRIYVHESVIQPFVDKFVRAVRKLKVGNGMDPETDIGSLINEETAHKFLKHVGEAENRGARLLYGGRRITDGPLSSGNFVTPAVLTEVSDDMLCMCEETFGPLAPISSFKDIDEVIERANRTEYGLAAYLYTTDLKTAFYLSEKLEAGTIGVNDDVPSITIAPFGGMKQSGLGRECGVEGLEAFMETKHISVVI